MLEVEANPSGNLQNECRKMLDDTCQISNGYVFLQDELLGHLQKENMVVEPQTVFTLHKPACGVWMLLNL